jgi:hypothetical protein
MLTLNMNCRKPFSVLFWCTDFQSKRLEKFGGVFDTVQTRTFRTRARLFDTDKADARRPHDPSWSDGGSDDRNCA